MVGASVVELAQRRIIASRVESRTRPLAGDVVVVVGDVDDGDDDDGGSEWTQRIGNVRANDGAPGWGDVVFVLDRRKWGVGVGGGGGKRAGSRTRDVVRGDAGERARVGGTETGFEVDFDVVRARVQLDV